MLAEHHYKGTALLESSSCSSDERAASLYTSIAWQTWQERRYLEQSRGEITFHCSRTKPLQWRQMEITAARPLVTFLGKHYFLCRLSEQADQMRQALVSADCYGSLTYTRWKGSMLLKQSWRNKDKNEKKTPAEISGNIFLFGKRFVLRGASAPLAQLNHGNFWLHLFSGALDFYIS